MMVTVATSLDVPIKLMFPRPAPADDPSGKPSHAMLGLGDVVLPGLMVGLALRFDLYLFYLRRQKRTPAIKEGEAHVVEKPQYHSLAGRWSDYFWSHSLTGRPLWSTAAAQDSKPEAPFTFPKTYFKASLVGYVLGLLVTLGVMMIWNHAQPALLYLVPGVLGSLWLTALARGELNLMWNYTEDVGDEEKDKKQSGEKAAKANDAKNSSSHEKADEKDSDSKRVANYRSEQEVLCFSIEAPWKVKKPQSVEDRGDDETSNGSAVSNDKHNWVPSKIMETTEQAGKRVRLN